VTRAQSSDQTCSVIATFCALLDGADLVNLGAGRTDQFSGRFRLDLDDRRYTSSYCNQPGQWSQANRQVLDRPRPRSLCLVLWRRRCSTPPAGPVGLARSAPAILTLTYPRNPRSVARWPATKPSRPASGSASAFCPFAIPGPYMAPDIVLPWKRGTAVDPAHVF
jgi:hypothetical protein